MQEAPEAMGPFQTARVKLAADMRRQGKRLTPQDLSSGPMFPQGHGASSAGVPRTGLARPQGVGPRNPTGADRPCLNGMEMTIFHWDAVAGEVLVSNSGADLLHWTWAHAPFQNHALGRRCWILHHAHLMALTLLPG